MVVLREAGLWCPDGRWIIAANQMRASAIHTMCVRSPNNIHFIFSQRVLLYPDACNRGCRRQIQQVYGLSVRDRYEGKVNFSSLLIDRNDGYRKDVRRAINFILSQIRLVFFVAVKLLLSSLS